MTETESMPVIDRIAKVKALLEDDGLKTILREKLTSEIMPESEGTRLTTEGFENEWMSGLKGLEDKQKPEFLGLAKVILDILVEKPDLDWGGEKSDEELKDLTEKWGSAVAAKYQGIHSQG